MFNPIEELQLKVKGRKIVQRYTKPSLKHSDYKWYVNAGSFLKKYSDIVYEDEDVHWTKSRLGSSYTERAGYPPNQLGFYVAQIRSGAIKQIDKITI